MPHTVVFTPEAESQLVELYEHVAVEASPGIAARFSESIIAFCESLSTFPLRGTQRDDVRPGLRIVGYRRRVVIAFAVDADQVQILGVFYGGQDYEARLLEDER